MQEPSDKIANTLEDLIFLEEAAEFNASASLIFCKGEVPQPRNGHKSFVKDKKLYVYGGTTDLGEQISLYSLDISRLNETEETPLQWKEMKFSDKHQTIGVSGVGFSSEQFSQSSQCRPFVLMFGGWTGSDYSDLLSLLNTTNMEIKVLDG